MSTRYKLTELGLLLEQLEKRKLYPQVLKFLKDEELKPSSGWPGIRKRLEENKDNTELIERFHDFVRELMLASDKHVYLLRGTDFDLSKLVADLPTTHRADYLAGKAPPVNAKILGWHIDEREVGKATITTILNVRSVLETEEVDRSFLSDEGRVKFGSAKIVAKKITRLRCYDHLVKLGDVTLLLLDIPPGLSQADTNAAEARYGEALRAQLDEDQQAMGIFIDLFRAVDSMWKDAKEGIVNSLRFVSNHDADILGKFSRGSTANYREHEFQKAGAKVAQVVPYQIGVKWTARTDHPMITLPGRKEQAMATRLDSDAARGKLNFMITVGHMSWEDFLFVLGRVRAHLLKSAPSK